ncbi:MAG TPA: DNA gyrase/topoisomerase IV subunit A, partial [Sphingobacterium sp.]|nr:DNA gyrase/topoisomerase IV subunit A [Sphingobacterium sp.]
PNGEAEVVNIQLKPHTKLRKLNFDLNFADIAIKGKSSLGNIVSKYPVKKITFKSAGVSTLAGRKIWYDDVLKRLNADERGRYLGEFDGDDKILVVLSDGSYELTNFDLNNHFDEKMIRIEKHFSNHVYAAVHQDGKSGAYYVKRFSFDDIPLGKRVSFINDEPGSRLILLTNNPNPVVTIDQLKGKSQTPETMPQTLNELIDIKKIRAQGNRLSFHNVQKVSLLTEEIDLNQAEQQVENDENIVSETKSEESASSSVSFEITNPDDVQINNDGQIGLF